MLVRQSIIAGNIKAIIAKKDVKQKAVAQKAGYSARAFSNMLNGRKLIADYDILPLCHSLNVTPNELFGVGESGVQ